MATPVKIKNDKDLLFELVSLQSSLNMRCFENTVMEQDTLLSETYWGNHASEHLSNIIKYCSSRMDNNNDKNTQNKDI